MAHNLLDAIQTAVLECPTVTIGNNLTIFRLIGSIDLNLIEYQNRMFVFPDHLTARLEEAVKDGLSSWGRLEVKRTVLSATHKNATNTNNQNMHAPFD